MKVIFMGTPDFSVPVLKALHEHHEVVCVYTQPPRPAGRGNKVIASPVHQVAEGLGIEVKNADGAKCDRCWSFSDTVGQDADHPTLCARCAQIVK